jgi:predicted transcriptional regulator
MLMQHKPTLTDISRQLGKSPSTVKQHLNELREMGMVRHVDDTHLGKFKYYECVPPGTFKGYGPEVQMAARPRYGSEQQVSSASVR